MQRMIAQDARIPHSALRTVRPLDLEEQVRFETSVTKLRRMPLWINDMASDITMIEKVVREIATTPPLSFVIIDYLQLIDAPPGFRGDRRAQVEYVSKRV
jgi:replicative DNA helicase